MRVLRDVTIDKQSALAAHPLFGQLSGEERERLVTYMRVNRCPAGTVLIRKGDPGSNMMVVMQGRVKICAHSEDGKELVFSLVKPGELFGEIALLDGSARTADAVALDDCELLVLERRDFVPFLSRHPEACMRLFGVLCQKLRRTSEQLEQRFFLEGEARLAKQLVNLAEIFGRRVDDGIRIDVRLSQSQLGNMVGMSRESVNKQIKQWKADGFLHTRDGFITIVDLEGLSGI